MGMFRQLLLSQPKIPTYIVPVEYLESDGGQYIDTMIVPTYNTIFEYDFQLTEEKTSTCGICGVIENRGTGGILPKNGLFIYNQSGMRFGGGVNVTTAGPTIDTGRHVASNYVDSTGKSVLKFDGVEHLSTKSDEITEFQASLWI